MGVEFKKMQPTETKKLTEALRRNVEEGKPIVMDPFDTSLIFDEQQLQQDMINAIQSVPCHY